MPELPEVLTIANLLDLYLNRDNIVLVKAEVYEPKILLNTTINDIDKHLNSTSSRRRFFSYGKHLFMQDFNDSDGSTGMNNLIFHMGMTGSMQLKQDSGVKHSRAKLTFQDITNDSLLTVDFVDPRKFGSMCAFQGSLQDYVKEKKLGIDVRLHTADEILQRLIDLRTKSLNKKKVKPIKVMLLDQHILAGIGNYLSSEILFHAGIHPQSIITNIPIDVLENLAKVITSTVYFFIQQNGNTLRNYIQPNGQAGSGQDHLYAYDQEKNPCQRCGSPIIAEMIEKRNTFFCAVCQRVY